ncbi:hypothetical protein GOALK_120_00171 [Gordonia alkanivorans NBRC 16433]|uniref:Uncharacterized protein n=2 Tax=Gordonia alkanivorans TaxID=84096 RepID=F9W272_9ACTN|nr:hypothetical protein GOALK_120_00171 [Gordonia alkanivorans NBRC 16433]
MFRGRHYGFDDDWQRDGVPTTHILGPWPTIFARLSGRGVVSRVHLGDISTMPGAWTDALVRGATHVIQPRYRWSVIRDAPALIASTTIAEVDDSLRRSVGRPTLIWIHVNLDEHVHYSGYDSSFRTALQSISRAARRWADAGSEVLLHSDHGQTRTTCSNRLAQAWAQVESPVFCESPAGGAGRVRWLYTRPGAAAEVRAILADVDAPGLIVGSRDDLIGILGPVAEVLPDSDAIVLATEREFPLVDRVYRFEHGSLTKSEMVVPLALWHR